MSPLTPAQLHALAIVAKGAGKVRNKLDLDEYEVDFGVQITGKLTVSGDQTVSLTSKPSAVDVIAALLEMHGPRKRLEVASSITAEMLGAVQDDTRELAVEIFDRLATSNSTTRRGAVSGQFDLAVIE